MLNLPNRLGLGLVRFVLRLLARVLRLFVKVAGAAALTTSVLFVLDMVLLGDKRRKPVAPEPPPPAR